MLIVDAHLDLAYSAIRFNRDLRAGVEAIRAGEKHLKAPPNGIATVALPELRAGGVGLVFGTLFGMPKKYSTLPDNDRLIFKDTAGAYAVDRQQLDYYRRLADEVEWVRIVTDRAGLEEVVGSFKTETETEGRLLGIVPLMEGAEAIREPEELELWFELGVRLIGPAWMSTRYAGGGWEGDEDFTPAGRVLMEVMAAYNVILDLTHLSDKAAFTALADYAGPVVATHCNARGLVDMQRQLSDDLLRRLAERGGVTGVVLANYFLKPGFTRTDRKETVTLDDVVAHVDYICQLTGSADHVGIGSDMDGGFGWERIPAELNSSADLPQIAAKLAEKGYEPEHVAAIMGGNWVRVLREAWGG